MLQGICVDTAATTVLEKGKTYFLFPGGPNHYYVSKFPKENSHFGVFRKSLFQIVQEDEWPPEPPADSIPVLDSSKIYAAKLIWTTRAYKTELGTYYMKPLKAHAYVYRDKQLKKCVGCFPLHWFAEFREVNEEENVTNVAVLETEVPKRETKEEKNEIFEQMSIFDFVE
ncbi:hypothetical protein [Parageobacillus thermoglucosidasius]|uniref:Uncharacterized protein n=1 Tax=Parageobacillus thermoglucosidasius TaxID=1426 RepID=A0A1B7KY13_PARTM|nr:hypothetical protein [Parageobacillus thermoglucosidasius]OAT74865.1 hypothetical protein A7K69_02215 [Parageobacillus thermoglucosidasius]